jgi:hypothetical protein
VIGRLAPAAAVLAGLVLWAVLAERAGPLLLAGPVEVAGALVSGGQPSIALPSDQGVVTLAAAVAGAVAKAVAASLDKPKSAPPQRLASLDDLDVDEQSRVPIVRGKHGELFASFNHLDMQSQDVLQRALVDYPGTVLIVSHNRTFLDPLVHKTLEFRPGAKPTLYPGNISYYLEKSAADRLLEDKNKAQIKANKTPAPIVPTLSKLAVVTEPTAGGGNRKDQRKIEADLRNQRNKVLKPLQDELESVETKIAEMEKAQGTLTEHLSTEEVAGDAQKFRETTHALEKITKSLELAFSRWGELTAQIETAEAKLPPL